MAGKTAILSVRIVSEADGKGFKQAEKQAGALEKKQQSLGDSFKSLAKPAAVVATGITAGLVTVGKLASDAEQNVGAVETVFGKAAGTVKKWASQSAESVGMSASSYDQLAASIGGSMSSAYKDQNQLASKTRDLIGAGADLSSVFGGSASEAVDAMGAALRGEFDPLERFGVYLNMTTVNQELARKGQDKLKGSALDAAKKQAIQNLIMKQAAKYHGNFAKEADTAAGQQQRATAAWQDAGAKLGTALLPVMVKGAQILKQLAQALAAHPRLILAIVGVLGTLSAGILAVNGAMKAWEAATGIWRAGTGVVTGLTSAVKGGVQGVRNFAAGFSNASAAASSFSGTMGTIGGKVRTVVSAMGSAAAATGRGVAAAAQWAAAMTKAGVVAAANTAKLVAMKAAQAVATAAQWLWNAAVSANPIMLIVLAIGAFIAAIVLAYKKVGWFRDFVDAVWAGIKAATAAVVSWFKSAWSKVMAAVKILWTGFKASAVAVVTGIRTAVSAVVSWFRSAWSKSVAAVKLVFNVYRAATLAVFNAIRSAVSSVASWFTSKWRTAVSAVRLVFSAYRAAVSAVFSGIRSAVSSVASYFTSRWRTAVSGVKAIVKGIGTAFSNVFNGVRETVRRAVDWIAGKVRAVKDTISNVLGSVGRVFGFSAPTGPTGYLKPSYDVPQDGRPFFLTAATPAPTTPALLAGAGRSAGVTIVNMGGIHVDGALDPVAVGRQVTQLVRSELIRSGARVKGQTI